MYIPPLSLPSIPLSLGHITSFEEAVYKGFSEHLRVQKTQVFIVRECQLSVVVSMHVKNIKQCSEDQTPKAMSNCEANSTVAPRNSMRTQTWSFERTTFPLQVWPN